VRRAQSWCSSLGALTPSLLPRRLLASLHLHPHRTWSCLAASRLGDRPCPARTTSQSAWAPPQTSAPWSTSHPSRT
jgi:hypothetical protein